MPQLIESNTYFTTAAAVAGTAAAAYPENSLTLRKTNADTKGQLISVHSHFQATSGQSRVTSAHLHDNNLGFNFMPTALNHELMFSPRYAQELVSKDELTVTHLSDATAGNVETTTLTILYDDVDGGMGNFIDNQTLRVRARANTRGYLETMQIKNTITSTHSGVQYSGSVALNAISKQMRTGVKYALLGAVCDINCAGVRIKSIDTSNVGIVIPLPVNNKALSANYFPLLSDFTEKRCIPVMDMSNPAGITLDVIGDENNGTFNITTLWVVLG
jgi:hypothetical protein